VTNKGPKLSALERVADKLLQLAGRAPKLTALVDDQAELSAWAGNVSANDPPPIKTIRAQWSGELTISSGEITVTNSYYEVDTEGDAASDDLDTINGGSHGMLLFLHPVSSSRDIVLKDGTGNIWMNGSADLTLATRQDYAMLLYDAHRAKWVGQSFFAA
jgi:hypothetical protein